MSPIDTDWLRRALAASETGSFAEAARQLGVSRQAVHRSIEALEAVVGGPLFDRGGRGLRPTSLGKELLKHAARLRTVEHDVRGAIAGLHAEPTGVIRIATPPVFGDTVLSRAVVRMAERWPSVRVHVRSESRRTDLVADDYDVMIRIGSAPPDAHFAKLLGHASVVLCGAPACVQALGPLVTPGQLTRASLLEYGPRRSATWGLWRQGDSVTLEVNPRITSDSASLLVEACLGGLGILRAPELVVRPHIATGRLVQVLSEWQAPRAEVWAVYGHRSASDPTLAALLDALSESFAHDA